ncbi:MAG: helix-turn-helix domain-containing protein, partial [Phycisphaerae bacterium]
FMSGLVCRLESPDEATCRQIVQSLTAGLNATFSDEVIEYIARRCRRNIREIQGALNSLDGHVSLSGSRKITLNTVRQILGDMTSECRKLIRIQDVEKVVCEAFGVSASELRSDSRRRSISIPRSVAMFLSRKHTCSAYREIGLYFGGRDHSTVVAAEKRIAE